MDSSNAHEEDGNESHPRAVIMRAIRADNLTWAVTLAQLDEDKLSESARLAICKMLYYKCDDARGTLLALHWGIFRKMTASRHE